MCVHTIVHDTLTAAGFSVYLVGGSVRDELMGLKPNDFDFTTDALPDETVKVFKRAGFPVYATGLKHGTVTVIINNEHVELTTMREESGYTDGRRPDTVKYTKDLHRDLSRRDFTFNAMAQDVHKCIVDLFNGKADIAAGTIRCVGDAKVRFLEDGLRPVRMARFAAKIGFRPDHKTYKAATITETYKMIAMERFTDELFKAMATDRPHKFIAYLHTTGMLDHFMPELSAGAGIGQPVAHHRYDVLGHSVAALKASVALTDDPLLRLAVLLHDVGKPHTFAQDDSGCITFHKHEAVGVDVLKSLCERLKLSQDQTDKLITLTRFHLIGYSPEWTDRQVRRWAAKVGLDNVRDIVTVRKADLMGQGFGVKPEFVALDDLVRRTDALDSPALSISDLAVNGHDLLSRGYDGPSIGRELRRLLELVLDDPSLNTKAKLLSLCDRVK